MKRRSPKACARTLALHAFIDVPTAFCPGLVGRGMWGVPEVNVW